MVSKEAKLRELEDYLYVNLKDIMYETEDPGLAAYRITLMIACHSDTVDPLRLEIYTSKLGQIKKYVDETISFFCGMGFLVVDDPDSSYMSGDSFNLGFKIRANEGELYSFTKENIEAFRQSFWDEDW